MRINGNIINMLFPKYVAKIGVNVDVNTYTELLGIVEIATQQLYSDEDLLAVDLGDNVYAVRNGHGGIGFLKVE